MKLYFDIGANSGEYTDMLINTVDYYNSIICVEANPYIIEKLKNRFIGNSKVKVLNKAVSSEVGKVDFYVCTNCDVISTCDTDWISNSRFSGNTSWVKVEVETISIDDMVLTYGIPEHIKIDVEGYELNVIKGMTKNYGSQIRFEWAEEKLDDIIEIVGYLSSLGYTKFGYMLQDKYDGYPSEFFTIDDFIKMMNSMCIPSRKNLWGMIFVDNDNK